MCVELKDIHNCINYKLVNLCIFQPLYLPDVRMSVQHGSHERSAGSGHATDEY